MRGAREGLTVVSLQTSHGDDQIGQVGRDVNHLRKEPRPLRGGEKCPVARGLDHHSAQTQQPREAVGLRVAVHIDQVPMKHHSAEEGIVIC